MDEDQVAVVVNFYAKLGVAAIKVTEGDIMKGDLLKHKRHAGYFSEEAKTGDMVGVKIKGRVRKNDTICKVVDSP